MIRVGVDHAGGGVVLTGSPDTIVNGVPASRRGDMVASHGKHRTPIIVEGVESILINGIPAAKIGGLVSCKHRLETSSPDVILGS